MEKVHTGNAANTKKKTGKKEFKIKKFQIVLQSTPSVFLLILSLEIYNWFPNKNFNEIIKNFIWKSIVYLKRVVTMVMIEGKIFLAIKNKISGKVNCNNSYINFLQMIEILAVTINVHRC